MKKTIGIALLAGWGLCFAQTNVTAQSYKTHISKQFTLAKAASASTLAIYNVFGSIKVEGYAGDKIMIELDETIDGKTEQDVEQAKKEVKLGFDQVADTVVAYTAEPYDSRPHNRWNNDNDNDDDRHRHYTVELQYVVKVPFNLNLKVSTINKGNIDIKDVYGDLKVNNINGGIAIVNAKSTTNAHTINGPITINYLTTPKEASSYYTINGKLEITYPANTSANLQFKSMNGQFYTDFPDATVLPTEIIKTQRKEGQGTTYKLNKLTQVKIGSGGKLFKFETLNGNIYIKKS